MSDIAFIQTGYFAKPKAHGKLTCLQSRHFDDAGNLLYLPDPDCMLDPMSQKHFLLNGDILYAAKGTKNFAALFSELEKPVVASTTFFVIRLRAKNILPSYLAWYLNKPIIKDYLQSQAKGTSIVSISKTTLEDLLIEIPSLEKQSLVLKINSLRMQEIQIRNELTRLYSNYTQALINQRIKTD